MGVKANIPSASNTATAIDKTLLDSLGIVADICILNIIVLPLIWDNKNNVEKLRYNNCIPDPE